MSMLGSWPSQQRVFRIENSEGPKTARLLRPYYYRSAGLRVWGKLKLARTNPETLTKCLGRLLRRVNYRSCLQALTQMKIRGLRPSTTYYFQATFTFLYIYTLSCICTHTFVYDDVCLYVLVHTHTSVYCTSVCCRACRVDQVGLFAKFRV